jgi:hypothetical protein
MLAMLSVLAKKAPTAGQCDHRFKLTFDHDTQEFSHSKLAAYFFLSTLVVMLLPDFSPIPPRLRISQNLPLQTQTRAQ